MIRDNTIFFKLTKAAESGIMTDVAKTVYPIKEERKMPAFTDALKNKNSNGGPSGPTKLGSVAAAAGSKPDRKSNEEIAKEVIRGNWGVGQERKDKLTAAGYDYSAVQSIVNEMMKK